MVKQAWVLPKGWTTTSKVRPSGYTAGRCDTYYICPAGKQYRSRKEVDRFLTGAYDKKHNRVGTKPSRALRDVPAAVPNAPGGKGTKVAKRKPKGERQKKDASEVSMGRGSSHGSARSSTDSSAPQLQRLTSRKSMGWPSRSSGAVSGARIDLVKIV